MSTRLTAILAVTAFTLLAALTARGADFVWTNTSSGNWSAAANWRPNQVPGGGDNAFITNNGTYTVTVNADASVNALTVGGGSGIQIISVSSGPFTINGASTVVPNGLFALNGGTLTGAGDVRVTGVLTWTSGTMSGTGKTIIAGIGTLNLSSSTHQLNRVMQNDGVATFTAGTLLMNGGTFNNNGSFAANSGSTLSCYGTGGVNAFNNAGTFTKQGTGQTVFFISSTGVPFNNSGTVNIQAGTLQLNAGFTQTSGQTMLNGGTVSADSTLQIQGGLLGGVGIISASVNSSGSVSPGASLGQLTIIGNFTQGSNGVLNIELAGSGTSTNFDRLLVGGAANLAGTLNVTLLNGFQPATNSSFTFLTANSRSGTFGTFNYPTNTIGLQLTYSGKTATIQETHVLFMPTVYWVGGSGDWNMGGNWSTGTVPGANDDVLINVAGDIIVTHSLSVHSVRSLYSQNALVLSGGSLAVSNTIQVNNAFTVAGGTLRSATVLAGTGGQGISATASGGTLDGVALACDAMIGNGSQLSVTNGLTLVGGATITLTNASVLYADAGTQTIGGTGQIMLASSGSFNYLNLVNGGGTILTLGPNVTLRGQGYIQSSASTLINQGTLSADVPGQTLNLLSGTLTNYGVLQAINGGTLNIDAPTWSNSGTILVDNSTVNLGGRFTQAGLGTISQTGGTVNITGTMDNTGSTLNLDAIGSLNLAGGTIIGGTILGTSNLAVIYRSGQLANTVSTLDGVTLNAPVRIESVFSTTAATLFVTNGLVLNAELRIGYNAFLSFDGNQTVSGTGAIFLENFSSQFYVYGSTLILGAGLTIHGESGFMGGLGTIINQGTIQADVGGKAFSVSTANFSNTGKLVAANGATLSINAAAWTSTGTISVNNATLNLGGSFTQAGLGTFNRTGGTVNLTGTLNSGGLALDTVTGTWNLGGTINGGTVSATDGAQLVANGVTLSGVTLGSDIRVGTGKSLYITNGLTFSGGQTITLDAGVSGAYLYFNSGAQTIGGTGRIVLANSLYNYLYLGNGGVTSLTLGPGVTLRGPGNIVESSASTLINQGTISADITGKTLGIALSGFANNGILNAINGGTLNIRGVANYSGETPFTIQAGSTVRLGSSLLDATQNPLLFNPQGNTIFDGSGTALNPQFLEVMSRDLGAVAPGFVNNFSYGALSLGNNTYVRLVNVSSNSPGTSPEALYANSLIVPAGCTLDLNGFRLYARAAQINGTLLGSSLIQIPDGGNIAVGTPTAGNISGAGELDEWSFFGRAGQTITVLVDSGSSNVVSPTLNYAEVRLLDANRLLVTRGSNNVAGQSVALTDVLLSADATYRIQVRAPANQPSSAGNYLVTVWEVTPKVAALVLNQTVNGRIDTPHSVDRWTFSALSGQQVQFNLVNASASGVAFSLRGPNGGIGFTNLVGDSGLVTLTDSGQYTLSAFGTGGAYDIDYAFRLLETVQTNLSVGSTYTGQFVGNGQAMLFRVDLGGDQPYRITLGNTGTSNRTELYLGFGLPPTRGVFNYADNLGLGSSREILTEAAYPGTYYVLVYGDSIPTPGQFSLKVETADVFVTRVSPARSGNGGTAIVEIQGVGLKSTAQVRLEGHGVLLPATNVTLISSTRLTAEFNLSGVASNSYQVVVTQGVTSTGLPFEVSGGLGPRFEADLVMPDQIGLNTTTTVYIEYQNVGDLPMVAPLLVLKGDGIGEPFFSLNPSQVTRDFWAASQPSFARKTISFFATGKIPGILMPGESARIPISMVGIAPNPLALRLGCFRITGRGRIIGWRLVEVPPSFCPELQIPIAINVHLLQFVPPSDLNVGSGQSQPDQPVSWQSLRTNVPPRIDPAAWEAIWQNYTNAAGGSAYSFFGMLQQNVEYLYRLGLLGTVTKNTDDLLAFEMTQADGLHMLRSLATATDGYTPAPGLRLSFDRSFPNNISGRYRMGALGRGWSHNWEERYTTNAFGDVMIIGQGGAQRTFTPDIRGGYMGDLGDNGNLVSLPGGALSLREKGGLTKEFMANGKLNFITDPNGNRITCGYFGDQLTSLVHSSGPRLDLTYNVQGRIATIMDNVGRTTRFVYDVTGEHLTSTEYYDGRILAYQYSTGQGAQREHALTQIQFPDQSHQFFTYNPQGRLQTMSRDGGSELVAYTYNSTGTVLATDAYNHTSKFLFDNRGLLVRMENPKGEVVQLRHDERFNLTGVTDPAGRPFDYSYDRQGNLIEIVNPLGHRTQFAYEPQFQRLSQLTDAKGNPTRYNYDDRGNLHGITYANGKSENWGYDAIGNPTTWTNRRRNDIDYQFNPTNGFLMAKHYPDGSRADYEYDARGNLIAASNHTGRISLDYFPTNDRLKRITYPGNRWLDYTYDAAGRRRTMTDQLGYQLRYDYDPVGRLRSITNSDNLRLVHYQYDTAGRMALKTLGNGVYTTYAYDDASRLEKLTNALPSGSVLSFFNYTYDERGRRSAMATHYGAWTYRYDDLGQLTNAALASTDPQISNQDLTYLYDAMGNRVRTVENGVATDYTANNLNQYGQAGGTTYAFDDDGSQIREAGHQGVTTLAYNFENRLIGVSKGLDAWDYGYDAFGNRMAAAENDLLTQSVIDPIGFGNVVADYDHIGNLIARYDYGAGLLSRSDGSGNIMGYTFDAIGSVHELVTDSGAVRNVYAYAPYGELMRTTRNISNSFEFVGEWGVGAGPNGLLFMRNRFLDSRSARFMSQDPLRLHGGDVNFYSYSENDPANYIDPIGLKMLRVSVGVFRWVVGKNTDTGRWFVGSGFGRSIDFPLSAQSSIGADGELEGRLGILGGSIELNSDNPEAGLYTRGTALFGPGLNANQNLNTGKVDYNIVAPVPGADRFGGGVGVRASIDGVIYLRDVLDSLNWAVDKIKTLLPIFARSGDPNQKLVLTGLGEKGYIKPGALIPYHIDFENETNAAAPAQTVYVTDRLANTLDWHTFELTEIGFGDERITLPVQTQHFETNVPVTINGASFVVQIQAGIRWDTGQAYCTFRSLDPFTGLLPPIFTGFLPPEDGTGRGKGYFSYVVHPKLGLATGTEIRNVALVDFDNGEVIATDQVAPHDPSLGIDTNKQALVTIDSGAPTSRVASLPNQSGHGFIVQWSGQDDSGGSGIASYDVLVSTNGGPFGLWIAGTNRTSATFIGELGHAYAFYSIARDAVGNVELPPVAPDALTFVITNAPLISPVTNQVVGVGETLVTSNVIAGASATDFAWSLGAPSFGASINPSNGVLRWTPACSQGSTTNILTVWATDRAHTNLSDLMTFTVAVKECVSPGLGRLVLRSGATGRLPIDLITSVPLTNLTTLVTVPTNRFINLSVEALVTQICHATIAATNASPLPGGEGQNEGGREIYEVTLATCTNHSLIGTQQVAWLVLTAVTNQHSAFVPVEIGPSIGTQPDGAFATNYVTQAGRVVIVGEEPLLEALRSTNGLVQLLLYAPTGTVNTVEMTLHLPSISSSWTTWHEVTPTNLLHALSPLSATNRTLFFRAVKQ